MLIVWCSFSMILLGVVVLCWRMLHPAKASDGTTSYTLAGLVCTSFIALLVILVDSFQDPGYQPVRTVTQSVTSMPTNRQTIRSVQQNPPTISAARPILKEKYYLLGWMWVGFAILYVLCHYRRDTKEMAVRGMMAYRGTFNPFPQEDVLDNFLVQRLGDDFSKENQQFVLDVLRIRQGKEGFLSSTPPSSTVVSGLTPPDPTMKEN